MVHRRYDSKLGCIVNSNCHTKPQFVDQTEIRMKQFNDSEIVDFNFYINELFELVSEHLMTITFTML